MRIGNYELPDPAVMGILNVTPDSFSDGGHFFAPEAAVQQAEVMLADGAAIIDIGGESTRPGAVAIDAQTELDRVVPVISALRERTDAPISVDTSRAIVMREAVAAGATMINDIRALSDPQALAAAVEIGKPICLMHMRGEPPTMQSDPVYEDVTSQVAEFLADRIAACVDAGLNRDLILVDPGIGFGKSPDHNIELLANLRQLTGLGQPLLVGWSRKSTLGAITGRTVDQRLAASIAAGVLAVINGASVVRTHDVGETIDALKVVSAVMDKEI